jgi:hypothetical protein
MEADLYVRTWSAHAARLLRLGAGITCNVCMSRIPPVLAAIMVVALTSSGDVRSAMLPAVQSVEPLQYFGIRCVLPAKMWLRWIGHS